MPAAGHTGTGARAVAIAVVDNLDDMLSGLGEAMLCLAEESELDAHDAEVEDVNEQSSVMGG